MFIQNYREVLITGGFPDGSAVKNPPVSTGDIRDMDSIPGSGRSRGRGMSIHSSILAWRISWTEEPGGLQSMRLQELDTT